MSEFQEVACVNHAPSADRAAEPPDRRITRRWITLLAALLAGALVFMAGVAWAPQGAAPADVRRGPKREAFLAGSERSIPILEDIAATLHRIDTRLAHIEKLLEQSAERRN